MKSCLYCDADNPDNALKCFNCGAMKFKTPPEDSDQIKIDQEFEKRIASVRERYRAIMEVEPDRSFLRWIAILGGVLLFGTLIYFFGWI